LFKLSPFIWLGSCTEQAYYLAVVDVALEEINTKMNNQLNSSHGAGVQTAKCRVGNETHNLKPEIMAAQDYRACQGAAIERMEQW
jgi:hypothetical protein